MKLLFVLLLLFDGSIRGKIIPADGASQVWAMSDMDTVSASINQGSFEISNAKAGTYKVYIDAVEPYRDFIRNGVQVNDGGSVDLGEIQLEK
jgi:hypothetical protein